MPPSIRRFTLLIPAFAVLLSNVEARSACLPDPPSDNDTVTCTGTDSTGYDASGATGLTITTEGFAILDESDPTLDSAILVSDGNTVTIGAQSRVNVTEDAGFGIRGGNDNSVDNTGRITIDGIDGRGISLGENTTGILPNGAVNSFEIFARGLRSIALETGLNTGVSNAGRIEVEGDEGRGISAFDRNDYSIPANISNTGTMNVTGNDAFGIKTGDGWIEATDGANGLVPTDVGVFNASGATIDVSGTRSFGIFTGDEGNLAFDNDSFVRNQGMIGVTGIDAIGISVGGNDLLDRFDFDAGPNDPQPLQIFDIDNSGTIDGGPSAGPLVEFRGAVAGRENRLVVRSTGAILADLTNQGMADRGIAVRGSSGDELIINTGTIVGDIEFRDGDDRYLLFPTATQTGNLRGGNGNDELILNANTGAVSDFDASMLFDFERIRIRGVSNDSGWTLSNTQAFAGVVEIADQGRLNVPTPITLGGDFVAHPTGTLDLTLDGTTPPLTIQGDATFDGTVIIRQGPNLMPSATPYTVIDATTRSGDFSSVQFPDAVGTRMFTLVPDPVDLLVLFEDVGLVAVARTDNQRAIAAYLAEIQASEDEASPDLQNLLDEFATATGTLANVFSALSPEVYDVHTTVVAEGGRRIARLLLDRPRECREGQLDPWKRVDTRLPCHARRWSPWLAATGGFRSREKFPGHPRYDSSLGGLVFGIDGRPLDDLDLTFAISSQRGTLDVAGAGESTVTLTDVSGHVAWTPGPLRIQAVLSWGHGFHKDRRRIRFSETATPIDIRGNEEHDSDRITLAGEVGWAFAVGPIRIEPIAGVDWAWVYQRPIREDGAGGFGIAIDRRDDRIGSVSGGVRLATVYQHDRYLIRQLEWMDGIWRPSIDVRWRQLVEGNEREIEARLIGAPSTVSAFTIEGKEDAGGVELAAGVSFTPKNANRLQFDLRYEAYLASHTLEQNLVARVQLGF